MHWRDRSIAILSGLWAIGLGALYIRWPFGPIEAKVREWGRWCVYGGVLAVIAGLLPLRVPAVARPAAAGLGLLALAQVPPILLWGTRSPFTDKPAQFDRHWIMALLHIVLLAGTAWAARQSWRSTPPAGGHAGTR